MWTWGGVLVFIFAGAPCLLAAIMELWDQVIKPSLIPKKEIQTKAKDMIARYGSQKAGYIALINAHNFWHRADSYQMRVWQKIYKEIRRQSKRNRLKGKA